MQAIIQSLNTVIVPIIVIGILIFIHELGHFFFAKINGIRVEKFSLGFGPKLWGKTIGDTEYKLSAVPLGGYVKMSGEEDPSENPQPWDYNAKKVYQRAQVIFAGPAMNIVLAYLIFVFLFIAGLQVQTTTVGSLMNGYPAKEAGLEPGDKIMAIDGKDITRWGEMLSIIQPSGGKELEFKIKRGDEILLKKITPKTETITDVVGDQATVGLVGITPGDEFIYERTGFWQAVVLGGKQTVLLTQMTYKGIWNMIVGKVSRKNVGGPLMIAKMAGEQARAGWRSLLSFMAIISLNLAVLNLLPLPVLDGGQLVFLAVEKLKGSPVQGRTIEWAQKISFTLLISLMVLVSFNDVLRFLK